MGRYKRQSVGEEITLVLDLIILANIYCTYYILGSVLDPLHVSLYLIFTKNYDVVVILNL